MSTALQDVRSPEWTPQAPAVALFLHGYGSNEHDLTGLAPALGRAMPWASLRAPLDLGHGTAWFPVTTPGNPDPQTVAEATDTITRGRAPANQHQPIPGPASRGAA